MVTFKNPTTQTGTTLIELLIALAIAGIVVSLGFTVYSKVTKEFSFQSRTADALRETILAKKKIDIACGKFAGIRRCSEREITGFGQLNNTVLTLRFNNGYLLSEEDTIVSGLKGLTFSLIEKDGKKGEKAVLLWEGTLAGSGGWIGGGRVVSR